MPHPTPISYTIDDTRGVLGIGRSRIYELIGEGKLTAVKSGSRTLVLADSVRSYVASLPAADIRTAKRGKENATAS